MSTPWTSPLARAAGAAFFALLLTVGAARVGHAQQVKDEYHSAPRDTISQEAYQGWKQFELNCSRCHGEYGVGTSFAPALVVSLKKDGTIPTKELFVQTVCAGRPEKGMPSWCALGLEMDKINNIYAYLKGRADGKIHIGRPAVRSEPEPSKSSS
jgi:mono/diheme cytochrome c family protein